ncbi:hypothetical protein Prubr_25010 [Polymorphospora rubra]|uniref:Uncharacterized protein n=1 Tax=Polymorphospora rubra TaxID=338584 RepID=A0A810MY38_9ACTN|nr:hypothetical protein Prubr_25010 [Polymorphospora rubra]
MNPSHTVERANRPLQAHRHHAEFSGKQVGQIAQIQVRPGFEDEHHRQPGRAVHGPHPPPFTHPDVGIVGGVAGGAFPGALALSFRLDVDRIVEGLDAEFAFEREGGPLGEVWNWSGGVGHDADPNGVVDGCPSPFRASVRLSPGHGSRSAPTVTGWFGARNPQAHPPIYTRFHVKQGDLWITSVDNFLAAMAVFRIGR